MRWLAFTLCSWVLACDGVGPGSTAGPIQVEPAAGEYPAGAVVSLTITNLSAQKLRYSLCSSRLERKDLVGDWQLASVDQRPCPAILEFLVPWASRQTSVPLPGDLELGAYRVRFPAIGARGDNAEEFVTAVQLGDSFVVHH